MSEEKQRFLSILPRCANVSEALKAANVGRSAHYHWLKIDKEYAERVKELSREPLRVRTVVKQIIMRNRAVREHEQSKSCS